MKVNTLTISTLIIAAVFIVIFALFAVLDISTSKKRKERYRTGATVTSYLMLLPAVLLAFMFVLLPILYSLGYAFTDYYLLEPQNISFVGFDNFKEVFEEIGQGGTLYHALINTLIFVVGVVPLQIGLALLLALFVNKPLKGSKIFKVCFFAPVVISLSVTSMLWRDILSGSETGLLNAFLGLFGAEAHDWLRDPATAMPCIIVLSAWQGCGYQMLIFLSGLTNIRKELYEAAALDGAGAWTQFKLVTWPGLRSTFVYILITVFIGACRISTQPMLLTGYQDHTVTLSYYMYQTGYRDRWVGLSSAVALLMTIVIGTITLIQRRLFREKD
ncbi:MAG: sugar ABC transporter permease [Clostridia bacterium]|nr:sugar ABC transporter permease [Clostridia bacterium]